jgi:ATP-dependent helicase HrpA
VRDEPIIANEMPKTNRALISELGNFIYNRFGLEIPASAWPIAHLPDHLKMRISITDPKGKEIHSGRDPAVLHQGVSSNTDPDESRELKSAREKWERTGITCWDFPDLPDSISIKGQSSIQWFVYPGLQKDKEKENDIALRLFQDRNTAITSHKKGVAALFNISFPKDLKFLIKNLRLPAVARAKADYFGGEKHFEKQLFESVINRLFFKNIRSKAAFDSHAKSVAPDILPAGRELLEKSMAVLDAYHEARSVLYNLEADHSESPMVLEFFNGLRAELDRLVPENFIRLYDANRLLQLPRYISAISIRAQRALVDFEKDQAKGREIEMFTNRLSAMLQDLSPRSSEEKRNAVEDYFWLIEEFKVSVFAQELKTAVPVSKKRLEKKLKEIERMV